MKLYLAARYSRRQELVTYATELTAQGIDVTSRWIDGRHETPPDGVAVDSPEHLRWAAQDDIADIEACDCLLAFTEADGSIAGRGRGGRHVELGYALACGKRIVICGYHENIFCHLPEIEFLPDWESAKAMLCGVAA